jgi:hypothetical protein
VIARGENDWEHVDTIRLPASLWFEDFSSLAIDGGRLCVVSQESSALWLGRLAPSAWEVVGDGVTFMFPADADGQTVYCNVEGVSWLSHDQVVIVSDRAKPGEQRSRCRGKDQSVHVFAIPDQSGGYCSSIYAVTLTGARGLRGARGCGQWRWVCARARPAAVRRPGALDARPATTGLLGSGAAWARLLRELLFGLEPVGDRVAGRLGQGDLIGAVGDRIVGRRARLRRGAARA